MANEEVTTSLNIDITQFKKALTEANRYIRMANSEFDNATAGTEKWTDSADGLRAKITQLNKVLDGQQAAAAALRHEYDRVVQEQGESSKGAQELAIKLNKQEAACKKTAAQIEKYKGDLEDTKKNTQETTEETGKMSAAFGKAATAAGTLAKGLAGIAGKTIVAGIKGIAAASAGLVTAFLATGEAQKEHLTAMAKLDAAYKAAGQTTKTAKKTYEELYGIIGDTDQAVEAAQQIALLADSEKDAAAWAEQAAAVTGRFGDSLMPEVFYESANETLKLNEATGAYVQLLEGTGQSVDTFNKGLAKCKTEQEKQVYMLEVTQTALAGAGDEYRKANAEVIENNKANAKLQETLSGVGKAALPVSTALKLIGVSILGDLLPHIKTLGTSFTEALGGSEAAAQKMGGAVGAILQNLGQKIVQALPTIVTVGTSIVTSLVQGLVQAAPGLANGVAQLVQYFIQAAPQLLQAGASMISSLVGAIKSNLPQLLTAGGEMLHQLLSGLVSNLPAMAQGAMTAIGGFVQGIQTYLPVLIQKGGELLGKLGEGIKTALPGLLSQGLDILMNLATTLYDAAPTLIDIGFDLISNLVQGILDCLPVLLSKAPEIISKFANIINDNVPKLLKKGVELVLQIVKGIISAIPTLIQNIPKIITAIVDVWEAFNWVNLGKKAITFLKDGIKSMIGAVKTAGSNVANSITSTIQSLPSKMLSFGKNATTNLGNAIKAGISTVKAKATGIVTGITGALKNLPQKMLQIGKDLVKGLWNGISDMTGWIIGKIQGFGDSILSGIKKFFGISSPSRLMSEAVGRWLPAGIAEGILGNTKTAVKAMAASAKQVIGAANAELNGATIGGPNVSTTGATGGAAAGGNVVNYTQIINSPKPVNRWEVYRQTKTALKFATGNA